MRKPIIRTVIYFLILTSPLSYGQISVKSCEAVTQSVINDIKSNNFKSARQYFTKSSNNLDDTFQEIKKEIEFNDTSSSLNVKEISVKTHQYIINRLIYKHNEDEIYLMLSFYYKTDSQEALIDKVEVRDKTKFVSKSEMIKRKRKSGEALPPPPSNEQ